MYFPDPGVPLNAVHDLTQGSRQLHSFWRDIDLWPKLIAACASSVAGFGLTRVFSRFQDFDRRSERVRLVSEASYALQLRQHLQSFCCDGSPWEIVERLKPQIDQFAEFHLLRVERALQIEAGEVAPSRSKSVLLRIFPFYQPARPWLWLHHTLYFIALGTLFFPIMGAYSSAVHSARGFSIGEFGHGLLTRWANILGAVLAAAFFAWLAYVNEKALEADTPGEPGEGKLKRPFRERFLLSFEPRGKGMLAAHILYLGYLGTLIRFSPEMLARGDYADLTTYILIVMLFVPLFVPGAVFNLASNYYDMKRASLAFTGEGGDGAKPRRKFWKTIRHALLFERPQSRWLWFLNIASYFSLLMTVPTTLLQIFACIETNDAWLTLILTPIMILPLVIWNMMVNYINGILEIRRQAVTPVAQAA